jgi:hypothetical protein
MPDERSLVFFTLAEFIIVGKILRFGISLDLGELTSIQSLNFSNNPEELRSQNSDLKPFFSVSAEEY